MSKPVFSKYFQSADFTKVFLTFYSTSLVWSRKRFRVSIENVSGISKEGAVTVISISVLLATVRAANRLKACRATTVSCWEKQTLLYRKEAATTAHRPCLGELVAPALTHLLIMLEPSCSHFPISGLPWHEDPSSEERATQDKKLATVGMENEVGASQGSFPLVQGTCNTWQAERHNSQNYTPITEKDTEESNNIATF